jgi:Aldehyde:ferredoxin oxidoreductase
MRWFWISSRSSISHNSPSLLWLYFRRNASPPIVAPNPAMRTICPPSPLLPPPLPTSQVLPLVLATGFAPTRGYLAHRAVVLSNSPLTRPLSIAAPPFPQQAAERSTSVRIRSLRHRERNRRRSGAKCLHPLSVGGKSSSSVGLMPGYPYILGSYPKCSGKNRVAEFLSGSFWKTKPWNDCSKLASVTLPLL